MGTRPPVPLCGERLGPDWVDAGTMCQSQSSPPGSTGRRPTSEDLKRRKRAKALKAADARTLLKASLPFVLGHMTDEQVQQMQRVLDAAVVNPDVEKEANDLLRRSIVAQSGSVINRDPRMVDRAYRAQESFIPVRESDKRIRLDFKALLTPGALQATTDNPDEAAYLMKVRQTLETRGVWLRFAPKRVQDQGAWLVWLSLGPDGDEIPTESGRLTRDTLLGTTKFGAGYFLQVDHGAIQSALEKEIRRLGSQIDIGLGQHQALARIRRNAAPVVVGASDLIGRANFPDLSIWDSPHQFVLLALQLNVGGNISSSHAFLVAAGIFTRNAAQLLADYIKDSGSGGERIVTVLKTVKTVGEVAELALTVTMVAGVAVRVMRVTGAAAGAGAAGAKTVAKNVSPAAFARTNKVVPTAFADTEAAAAAKNVSPAAYADTKAAKGATLPSESGIAEVGRQKSAWYQRLVDREKDRIKEWEKVLGRQPGEGIKNSSLPIRKVEEIEARLDAKWGKVWLPGD